MKNQGLSRCAELDSCGLWRILEVTPRITTSLDMNDVLRQAIDSALEVLDAERGTIFLFDAEREELFSTIATGSEEIRFPANQGIAGESA